MALLICLSALALQAQDALRLSLAGEEAAHARRQAITTLGYYNILLGPTAWRFNAGLGVGYNDNVRSSEYNPESDVIFRPEIGVGFFWPVTDKNALMLTTTAGYSAYLEHNELSRYYIRPGSELSFDIYTGDFTINLHDRFSIIDDAYQDPTVAGNDGYSRLQNAVGASVAWDLNQAILRAGYDHVNYVTLSGNTLSEPNGQQEVFYGSAGYNLRNIVLAGIELGGSLIDYTTPTTSGGVQWNTGVFCDSQLTPYLRLRGSAGYTVYAPDKRLLARTLGNYDAVYFDISALNRLNQYISQTLAVGRNVSISFYGSSVDAWFARWSANWLALQKTTLGLVLDFQHGEELQVIRERFDWLGGEISLTRPLTRKLTGRLAYTGYWRESDLPNRSYAVNTVGLRFTYAF